MANACGSSRIGLDDVKPTQAYRRSNISALDGPSVSIDTQTTLRRFGLREVCQTDRRACIRTLHEQTLGEDLIADELFALAELSLYHAEGLVRVATRRPPTTAAIKAQLVASDDRSLPPRIRNESREYYLAAALYAYAFLFPGEGDEAVPPLDPRTRIAADIYERGLAAAFANDTPGGMTLRGGSFALPFGTLMVSFDQDELRWGQRTLERFHWLGASQITGLNNRYRDAGIGAAVAAKTKLTADTFDFVAKTAWVPATVVLRLTDPREQIRGEDLQATLEVFTANERRSIEISGNEYPLEFEPSAALAAGIEQSRFWENELARFLGRAVGISKGTDLAALEPYVTGKIPAVFVHGTDSSAATWANMVNDLLRDPRIREKYHFWFFSYESGSSILYSEMLLRRALNEAVTRFHQAGAGDCLDEMIVLGHSQGGLLTKLSAVESGNVLWDAYFKKPFDAVPMRPEMKTVLGEMAFLEPLPYVKRVVFISTPHRGSFLAGPQFVRRLAARLIRLPREAIEFSAERSRLKRYMRPEARIGRSLTSIDNMSPGDPFIEASARLEVAPGIPSHSIISLLPGESKATGDDGVVKYSSAHLDWTDSELVVPSGHSVLGNPAAIEEVRRLLLLHAEKTSCEVARQREIAYPGIPLVGEDTPAQ